MKRPSEVTRRGRADGAIARGSKSDFCGPCERFKISGRIFSSRAALEMGRTQKKVGKGQYRRPGTA